MPEEKIKDAAAEVAKSLEEVRDDIEAGVEEIVDMAEEIRKRPVRKLLAKRIDERLDNSVVGRVMERLGRRRRGS